VLRQVLSEMVTRKYLEQQALNAKLDREPGVLLELLRARSQVLASAYAARTASAKAITQSEVDKYIANNPLKFEQRQMLTTDQITLPIAAQTPSVADANKNATSLEDVDQNLTAAGISHGRASGAISTADIPQDFYNLIQDKKDSSVFFVRSGNNGIYFKVKAIEPAALKGDATQAAARQYLRADRLKAEMGLASVSASMEAKFSGDYAQIMKDGSSAAGRD
jgi:EpsD family peptidyl-prolyl cis-trans isomerase